MAVKPKSNGLKDGFDFGGWATKYNVKCTDGRTIAPNAFAHTDGIQLPLVWQHLHNDTSNILGHAVLEHRDEGVYAWGRFNTTPAGERAKTLVHNGDIQFLSIYANQLVEERKLVHSGEIREVSLVVSGANRGARIDNISLQHADGSEEPIDDEAIIYTPETLFLGTVEDEPVAEHAEEEETSDDKTVGDILNSLTEEQSKVVYALMAELLGEDLEQSEEQGENSMKTNVFEKAAEGEKTLSHAESMELFATAVETARRTGGSLRDAVVQHAGTYGIDNIGYLFPDAKNIRQTPDYLSREMGWVGAWMSGVNHTPFSRVKSMYADITADEARAKGYTTGNQKIEEVFAVLKRTTEPQTIYKLQKLDRDDILDITDFNVVSWLKAEMRMMLDEEIARACLVGDGRTFGVDDDAINPVKVRPILTDDAVYSHKVSLAVTVTDPADIIDDIIAARVNYKGSGSPTMYIGNTWLTSFLLLKDTTGRRIYRNVSELASELNVARIVEVEVLEGVQRVDAAPFTADLIAILVNPRDYTIGADKGGAVNMFDDFDIDYNQYKYLIETRLSGALTRPKSALIIERKTA